MKTIAVTLLVLLLSACGTYSTSDRYYVRDGHRVYGAAAPVEGHELICHKGKKTMSLPSSAIGGHMGHGDRRGRC
jgi:uncharacterized lipoprotein